MTPNSLLCAITANTNRRFIINNDEMKRLVDAPAVAPLLEDRHLFTRAYLRLVADGFDRQELLKRLIAVFGVSRTADSLMHLFNNN